MARVPYLEAELPANIFKTFAHRPNLAAAYGKLGGRLLSRGVLDPKLRELVINAVAVHLEAPYEWSHHAKMALDAGATTDELEAVRAGKDDALTPLDGLAVSYAKKVDDRNVTDADVQALRDAGLDDASIVELTLLAGFYGMTARFLLAMDVETDEGNPKDFDLP
jgi:4-carboxymuconolactone decarboxylase